MTATKPDERAAYRISEAADLYAVSDDTIRKAINKGDLRAKKVGNQYRIGADALRDWFDGLESA